jgi:hypothetical protein
MVCPASWQSLMKLGGSARFSEAEEQATELSQLPESCRISETY